MLGLSTWRTAAGARPPATIAAGCLLALTGCYAEAGAAYYPRATTTVTPPAGAPTTDHTRAWSILVKVGFYLDIPIRPWRTAIGLGLSPAATGGEALQPGAGPRPIVGKGTDVRLDVAAPVYLIGRLQPRLSLVHTSFEEAAVTTAGTTVTTAAAGGGWFVGGSLGGHTRGSTVLASVGLQTASLTTAPAASAPPSPTVDTSAWGVGARLLFTWTPSGKFMKYYEPSAPAGPQPPAGCYYADHCDVDGNCTSTYTCP